MPSEIKNASLLGIEGIKGPRDAAPIGFGEENLQRETNGNGRHQRNDNRLDFAKTKVHHAQQNQNVEAGDQNAPQQAEYQTANSARPPSR